MSDSDASVRLDGRDHYSATMLILVLIVVPIILFLPVGSLVGGKLAAILTIGPVVLGLLVAPSLRYEITLDRTDISVQRLVLGIPYSHTRIDTRNAWVQVWGTGDWGDEGDWPAKRYCMIGQERPYTRGTRIGSPKDARHLEQFLKSELDRLRRSDATG